MRYVFSFGLALALGLALMAGCSDENGEGGTDGTAGSGGMAGTGGMAGEGGSGGAVTGCTGAEDNTACQLSDETLGLCYSEVCFVFDCDSVGTASPCIAGSDGSAVEPIGLCEGRVCVAAKDDCTGEEDGTPCLLNEEGTEIGFCDAGVCGLGTAPEIEAVFWFWEQPCDANASGQGLQVLVAASDEETPREQLTYSGTVQDCSPDLNAADTDLSCDVYLGARQSEAIVTDLQGNQDTMFFAPDPCTDGCVGGGPCSGSDK